MCYGEDQFANCPCYTGENNEIQDLYHSYGDDYLMQYDRKISINPANEEIDGAIKVGLFFEEDITNSVKSYKECYDEYYSKN